MTGRAQACLRDALASLTVTVDGSALLRFWRGLGHCWWGQFFAGVGGPLLNWFGVGWDLSKARPYFEQPLFATCKLVKDFCIISLVYHLVY